MEDPAYHGHIGLPSAKNTAIQATQRVRSADGGALQDPTLCASGCNACAAGDARPGPGHGENL